MMIGITFIDFPQPADSLWTAFQLGGHITHPGHLPDINNQPFLQFVSGIA